MFIVSGADAVAVLATEVELSVAMMTVCTSRRRRTIALIAIATYGLYADIYTIATYIMRQYHKLVILFACVGMFLGAALAQSWCPYLVSQNRMVMLR